MVIGNGDIARTLIDEGLDRDDVTFFASGVSNSKDTNTKAYFREQTLLELQEEREHIVYFSSLCVYYSDSMYAHHKRNMERMIKNNFSFHTIIRLGNISWGHNPNTIINYFKSEFDSGRTPMLQDAYRHIISLEEFVYWIKNVRPGVSDIMNIPGEFVHVNEIWRRVQNGTY